MLWLIIYDREKILSRHDNTCQAGVSVTVYFIQPRAKPELDILSPEIPPRKSLT